MPTSDSLLYTLKEKNEEIARLTAERDAIAAGAFEAAARRIICHDRGTPMHSPPQLLTDAHDLIMSLTPTDAKAALDRMIVAAEQRGQIKAGVVFSDTNPEEQYTSDAENACSACGGSGHRDDTAPIDFTHKPFGRIKPECATEGCGEPSLDHIIVGGIGSDYCFECAEKVIAAHKGGA